MSTTPCPACQSYERCDGCRLIEGRYEVVGRLTRVQEEAMSRFLAAKAPEDRRQAYRALEDFGLPLCAASPRFGDESTEDFQ